MTAAVHLFWALANSIWQSAVLAGVVYLAIRAMRGSTAAVRHALFGAVLIACAIVPVANLLLPVRTYALSSAQHAATEGTKPRVGSPLGVSHVESSGPIGSFVTLSTVRGEVASVTPGWRDALDWVRSHGIAGALAIWTMLTLVLLCRLALGYVRLRVVKRNLIFPEWGVSERLASDGITTRRVAVGFSDTVGEPCVIGFRHPVVALPARIASALPSADIARVLRHECAHVERFDDYGNLVQQLIVATFAFNPVVHILARALDIDREIACDDAAADAAGDRIEFAKCLYEIARGSVRRHWLPAAGFARNRSQIGRRVAHLLDRNHRASTRLGILGKIAAVSILVAAIPLCFAQVAAMATPTVSRATPAAVGPIAPAKPHRPVAPARVAKARHRARAASASTSASASASSFAIISIVHHSSSLSPPAPVVSGPAAMGRRDDGFLEALDRAGFKNLTVDQLIAMRNHGVSGDFIRALAADHMTPMPVENLISLADAGVSAEYMKSIRDAGYPNISSGDLIRLMNAGVSGAFVRRVNTSSLGGPRPVSIDDLIKLSNAGI